MTLSMMKVWNENPTDRQTPTATGNETTSFSTRRLGMRYAWSAVPSTAALSGPGGAKPISRVVRSIDADWQAERACRATMRPSATAPSTREAAAGR